MPLEGLRSRKEWLALIGLALIAVGIWCRALTSEPRALTVVFLDVGQGDCTFLRTPSGRTMLIDGGGRPDETDVDRIGMTVLEPFLRREGITRVDLVVLTHPHDDHVQGLIPVIRDFRIGTVLDSGVAHGARAYQQFLSTIKERHIPYRRAMRGQSIAFGDGVSAQVLNPPAGLTDVPDAQANDTSVVLRVTYGRSAVLVTGDAGKSAELDILASDADVRSDVLKVGHHGSNYATGEEWLAAVRPRLAVISVGKGNPFGHPAPETMRRLAEHGVKVFRTDERGAVTMEIGPRTVSATTVRALQ